MNPLSLFGQASEYTYYYSSDTSNVDPAVAAGAVMFGILFGLLAAAVIYVITALCLSRIFKKTGVETWKAWVPIYNTWVMLELGGQQGFWAVLTLLPIVNIIAAVFIWIAMYQIGLNFGKPSAFILLGIFFPLIWLIWLAVDKSTWKGAASAKPEPTSETPSQPTTSATK